MILWRSSSVCVAAAAFCFSFIALFSKLLDGSIPAVQLALVTSLISWGPTTAAVLWHGRQSNKHQHHRHWGALASPGTAMQLILRGTLGLLNITCFFGAVQLLPLQEAVPLYYCSTVVSLVMESLIYSKPMGRSALLGCLMTLAGVGLVALPACPIHAAFSTHANGSASLQQPAAAMQQQSITQTSAGAAAMLNEHVRLAHTHVRNTISKQSSNHSSVVQREAASMHSGGFMLKLVSSLEDTSHSLTSQLGTSAGCSSTSCSSGLDAHGSASHRNLGVFLALAGAVFNAAQFLVVARIGTAVTISMMTWFYHTTLVVLAGGWMLASSGSTAALMPMPGSNVLLLVMGTAVATMLGQVLLSRGLQLGNASKASAINTSQVLWSFVWDVAVLGTPVTVCGLAGAASVVAGVLAVCWPSLVHSRAANAQHRASEASNVCGVQAGAEWREAVLVVADDGSVGYGEVAGEGDGRGGDDERSGLLASMGSTSGLGRRGELARPLLAVSDM